MKTFQSLLEQIQETLPYGFQTLRPGGTERLRSYISAVQAIPEITQHAQHTNNQSFQIPEGLRGLSWGQKPEKRISPFDTLRVSLSDVANRFRFGKEKTVLSPLGAVPVPPSPTPLPPHPFPFPPSPTPNPPKPPPPINRIDPYPVGDGTPDRKELYPKLQTKTAVIQKDLFDAILRTIQDDYQRRLALALSFQESTGGKNLYGDYKNGEPRSFGAYHIMPGNAPQTKQFPTITKDQAMDYDIATQFLLDVMNDQLKKGKKPFEQLRRWNSYSGYQKTLGLQNAYGQPYTQDIGPRYDVDIPRFATMAAFLRGE